MMNLKTAKNVIASQMIRIDSQTKLIGNQKTHVEQLQSEILTLKIDNANYQARILEQNKIIFALNMILAHEAEITQNARRENINKHFSEPDSVVIAE